jgi:hypothetical protein
MSVAEGRWRVGPQKLTVPLLACTISLFSGLTVAVDDAKSTADRSHAFELYQQGKMVEVMPLLEKLAAENPKEETESLHMLIAVSTEIAAKKKRDLTGSDFGTLAKVEKAGLLEPFVLLNRADNGIARDYADYRATSRDKIRQYLDQVAIPQLPSKEPTTHD